MINVLIVDDDAMVAELNHRYVTQLRGFQCCGVASTLEQAKALVLNHQHPIDLILLDVYMQQENGLDLLPVLVIRMLRPRTGSRISQHPRVAR